MCIIQSVIIDENTCENMTRCRSGVFPFSLSPNLRHTKLDELRPSIKIASVWPLIAGFF